MRLVNWNLGLHISPVNYKRNIDSSDAGTGWIVLCACGADRHRLQRMMMRSLWTWVSVATPRSTRCSASRASRSTSPGRRPRHETPTSMITLRTPRRPSPGSILLSLIAVRRSFSSSGGYTSYDDDDYYYYTTLVQLRFDRVTTIRRPTSKGSGRRFGMGAKPSGGLGDGSPPAGSKGRAPLGDLGDEVPRSWRILKVVTSKFYAFWVVFHTFSPT